MCKILILLILMISRVTYGESFSIVDFRAENDLRPMQIMGTMNPPTLLINGKRYPLVHTHENILGFQGLGVWINGQQILTQGRSGRFFKELSSEETAVPSLVIFIQALKQKKLFAKIPLRHLFLEAPHVPSQKVPQEQTIFDFRLTGSIPLGSTLTVQDAIVNNLPSGLVEVSLKLSAGRSVLAAQLEEDGRVQIFNVPVQITVKPYVPEPLPAQKTRRFFISASALSLTWFFPTHGGSLNKIIIPPLHISAGYQLKDSILAEIGFEHLNNADLLQFTLNWRPISFIELGPTFVLMHSTWSSPAAAYTTVQNVEGKQASLGLKLGFRVPVIDRLEFSPFVFISPMLMSGPLQGFMQIDPIAFRFFF